LQATAHWKARRIPNFGEIPAKVAVLFESLFPEMMAQVLFGGKYLATDLHGQTQAFSFASVLRRSLAMA